MRRIQAYPEWNMIEKILQQRMEMHRDKLANIPITPENISEMRSVQLQLEEDEFLHHLPMNVIDTYSKEVTKKFNVDPYNNLDE